MGYVDENIVTSPLVALREGKTSPPVVFTTGGDFAQGTITFADNPTAADTITLDGVYVEFSASATDVTTAGTVGDPLIINIKASLALTLDELIAAGGLNSASCPAAVKAATYTEDGVDTLTITHDTVGTGGNAFTLAASADTVSAATLAGGEASSALPLTHQHIQFAIVDGQELDQNFTLADGEECQILYLYLTLKQDGNVVITPSNLTGGSTITFDALDEFCVLYFAGGSWIELVGTADVA